MRIEDRGSRIEDRGSSHEGEGEADLLNPQSAIPDPVYMERVHWRCRRGLLELDIVLGRFVELRYAGLDKAQQAAFDALLDMPDTVLWDMITGREALAQESQRTVLEWLKSA
jgi:antitoxin CptB